MSSRESTEACRNPKPSFSYNRAAVKLLTKHGHTNTDPNAITPNKQYFCRSIYSHEGNILSQYSQQWIYNLALEDPPIKIELGRKKEAKRLPRSLKFSKFGGHLPANECKIKLWHLFLFCNRLLHHLSVTFIINIWCIASPNYDLMKEIINLCYCIRINQKSAYTCSQSLISSVVFCL